MRFGATTVTLRYLIRAKNETRLVERLAILLVRFHPVTLFDLTKENREGSITFTKKADNLLTTLLNSLTNIKLRRYECLVEH